MGNFRLGAFVQNSQKKQKKQKETFGIFGLGYSTWDLGFKSLALDLRLGIFGLGSLDWDLRLGILGLVNWAPEAGGIA